MHTIGASLLGGGSAAFGVTAGELPQPAPTREALQEQALEQYASLLDSFGDSLEMNYPDYYAGAYLNSESKLVIKTANPSATAKRSLQAAAQNEALLFEEAEYSYDELIEIKDAIFNYMEGHPDKGRLPIELCSLDEENNRVVVYLQELTDENIARVKNVVDSPAISFTAIPKSESDETASLDKPSFQAEQLDFRTLIPKAARVTPTLLYSGNHIYTDKLAGASTQKVDMSVGYRAKYQHGGTTEIGFLTAGHGTKDNGGVYSSSLTKIGTVTRRIFDSRGDFAFVKMTNTTTVYSSIAGQSGSVSSTYGTALQGMTVYKCGYAGGIAYGVVESSSAEAFGTAGVKDLLQIKLTTGSVLAGDSGGIVYCRSSSGVNIPVEIISGQRQLKYKYLMSMKAGNIAQFGIYPR